MKGNTEENTEKSMDGKMDERLMRLALEARERSYSPYSHFRVGAALLCGDGSVYTGCNIENAAFTPGICAERTAFAKAVSDGKRSFRAIAIAGGPEKGHPAFTAPCGVCRQVMAEFCDPESFRILLGAGTDETQEFRLKELLPFGFGPGDLKEECEG